MSKIDIERKIKHHHDYCEICENILDEYEGDICCWCEERSTDNATELLNQ